MNKVKAILDAMLASTSHNSTSFATSQLSGEGYTLAEATALIGAALTKNAAETRAPSPVQTTVYVVIAPHGSIEGVFAYETTARSYGDALTAAAAIKGLTIFHRVSAEPIIFK